jgi:hypothetical protein
MGKGALTESGENFERQCHSAAACFDGQRRQQSLTDEQGAADGDQDHHRTTPCRTCITEEKNC